MDTRSIGSLTVGVVGLGCNNFGMRIGRKETASVVGAALDAGITLFDTADIYGGTKSESYLGAALGTRRDEIVLATKFGVPYEGHEGGAGAAYIRTAVEDSLTRLGTDRIDLYQLHAPDQKTPIAETRGGPGRAGDRGKDPGIRVLQLRCRHARPTPGPPWSGARRASSACRTSTTSSTASPRMPCCPTVSAPAWPSSPTSLWPVDS